VGRYGLVAVIAGILLIGASPAAAVTNSFQGPGTDWNTDANWSLGHKPTSGEDVVINTGAVTLSSGVAGVANSISIDTGAPATGSLAIDTTHTLTVGAGTSTINGNISIFGTSTLTLGGATTWSAGSFSMQNSTLNLNAAFSIAGDLSVSDFGGNQVNIGAAGSLTKSSGSARGRCG
jgi:hypothetical protein